MQNRRLWAQISEMSEDELRLQVVIPLLRATPGVSGVTDVHGMNERGLDVVFFTENSVEPLCYGMQLKAEDIGGGGKGERTVQAVVNQLNLAEDYTHPVLTKNGEFPVDRFVVATSGVITSTAREEIVRRVKKPPVLFWDGNEVVRRIHQDLPELFRVSDGISVSYLRDILKRYDALDALDQVPGVAKRTLSQVFVEGSIRRKYDPTVSAGNTTSGVASVDTPALSLLKQGHNAILVADQDSGKTSLLRMIALNQSRHLLGLDETPSIAGENAGLPILVRAKDVVGSALTVEDGIAAELRRMNADELVGTLEGDLAKGNYFLLIDGFSEFTKEEDKELLSRLIEEFATRQSSVRVIVSARPVDFLTPRYLTTFYQYTLGDFGDKQVGQLLKKWTHGSGTYEDVAKKLVSRLREALQLPGSPIPATIGVMLHEKDGHFITNTAEAIDRYMAIRLGRYAHELGMKQEVEWTRKQDLLAEVAFTMINDDKEALTEAEFIAQFNAISVRRGDSQQGVVILEELVGSGVLVRDGAQYTFHRSSLLDFFAGQHLFRTGQTEEFALEHVFERRWGGAIVFASGLQRQNSGLLPKIASAIERHRKNAIGDLGDDYFYAAYLCGRVLANSEGADHGPRIEALRTVVAACARSIPGFEKIVVEKYGAIGRLLALIGAESSFFGSIGVPWLRIQLKAMLDEPIPEEERFMLASTYAQLGFDDAFAVLRAAVKDAKSIRVVVALDILLRQLHGIRGVTKSEEEAFRELRKAVKRKLAGQGREVEKLLKVKSKVLDIERQRLKRIMAARRRGEDLD
jgi:hypothetical protein